MSGESGEMSVKSGLDLDFLECAEVWRDLPDRPERVDLLSSLLKYFVRYSIDDTIYLMLIEHYLPPLERPPRDLESEYRSSSEYSSE